MFLVSSSDFVSDPRPRVTRPAPAGHTTCARGSHDLRPRVTRPAPAGHATCARGSLTLCRSGTGNGPAKLGTSSTKRKSGSAERELGLAARRSRSEKPCAASSVALVQRNIVLPRNYSAIIALCLLVWDSHPADRLQSRIGVRVFSFVGFS